jgi:monofunctional chorismate mutase
MSPSPSDSGADRAHDPAGARAAARVVSAGIAAVRGAITVPENTAEAIRAATARLLTALIDANRLEPERIVSALFTATPDLDADFPAHAARRLGWTEVPLLGAREMAVPGALPRVVRVLITVSGIAPGARLSPVYLDGAAALRPDLAAREGDRATSEASRASGSARASATTPRRVALIGLGQIGGSIALALGATGRWWRVGYDPDRATLERARTAGAVDEAADSLAAACARAELAVIATPHSQLPRAIDEASAALPRGAALLDTGSARRDLAGALERAAARGVHAVGGHPLAGSEGRGFDAARAELFQGTRFAVLRVAGDVPAVVSELVRDLGAEALPVTAEEHDRGMARTSHLPYVIACALEATGRESAARGLSGPAFRDMTRVSRSDPEVALGYCRANADQVATAWRDLRATIDARIRELESGT